MTVWNGAMADEQGLQGMHLNWMVCPQDTKAVKFRANSKYLNKLKLIGLNSDLILPFAREKRGDETIQYLRLPGAFERSPTQKGRTTMGHLSVPGLSDAMILQYGQSLGGLVLNNIIEMKDNVPHSLSESASESAFSMGGRIVTDFRSRLGVESVEALVCSKDWYRGQGPSAKLMPVGYGIKKLQIMMTIIDDLVSVDTLIEDHLCVEPANEYIQSCDIVAFNKICEVLQLL
ncbi:hypothetical protein QYE76_055568 [Lolium multiflorum]|uniref:Translation elongation factor EF1B beta/delta subunit guanine nucleotide exchange domain-containing protein n=1 Tax=Lolium multiflorum TaxID=4521 RepID=A0AAD8T103_LOLMU|nr:hypothetical protein QYE76_055568 [Lolium multiflorum]